MLDALEAVVSTRATVWAEADDADRQLDLVDRDQQIPGRTPERAPHEIFERLPAQVHIGLRLYQPDLYSVDGAVSDLGLAVLFPAVKTPNVGEVVDQPPADVVSCRSVF